MHQLLFNLRYTRNIEKFRADYKDLKNKHNSEYQAYLKKIKLQEKGKNPDLLERLHSILELAKREISNYQPSDTGESTVDYVNVDGVKNNNRFHD